MEPPSHPLPAPAIKNHLLRQLRCNQASSLQDVLAGQHWNGLTPPATPRLVPIDLKYLPISILPIPQRHYRTDAAFERPIGSINSVEEQVDCCDLNEKSWDWMLDPSIGNEFGKHGRDIKEHWQDVAKHAHRQVRRLEIAKTTAVDIPSSGIRVASASERYISNASHFPATTAYIGQLLFLTRFSCKP